MDDEMEMNEKRVMTLDDWIRQSPLPRIEARMLLQKAGGYSRVQYRTSLKKRTGLGFGYR